MNTSPKRSNTGGKKRNRRFRKPTEKELMNEYIFETETNLKDQKTIYELGINGYLVPNQEDALAPGGFLHSEKMILIDQQQRIRGYYDGTDEENISKIVKDIKKLL